MLNQTVTNKILKAAKGQNPNQLTPYALIKDSLFADARNELQIEIPKSWLYDLTIEAGKSYIIVKTEN